MAKVGMSIWITRSQWQELKSGKGTGSIELYAESDLHHFFGDNPQESVVKVDISISEVEIDSAKSTS